MGWLIFVLATQGSQQLIKWCKKRAPKPSTFIIFGRIIQKFVLITHQLNWCYWKEKVDSFQCRNPHLSISYRWKVMSIWILKNYIKLSFFQISFLFTVKIANLKTLFFDYIDHYSSNQQLIKTNDHITTYST